MRRYWVEEAAILDDHVRLAGDVFHHIFQVCRLKVGDKFEVLGSDERCYYVEVVDLKKSSARAKILSTGTKPTLQRPLIHLAVSLPRWTKMDAIVEKSVELGVFSIHPFFSARSFVKKSDKISAGRFLRWSKIVQSATQQCGRGELLKISDPLDLSQLLDEYKVQNNSLGLFPYEGDVQTSLKSQLQEMKAKQTKVDNGLASIWIFVGSEGGFTGSEVQLFIEHGLSPFTLGDQILRVETACLALISIIKYEFNLLARV